MKFKISRAIGPAAMAVAVAIALVLLEHELKAHHYGDLMRQVWTLPHLHLALALLLTAVAYAVLPGYDVIALAYVDHPLPLRRIAFGSFIAYALSHSLGFPLLSGGPVRYRFWSVWGLSTSEIAQAIGFAGATAGHRYNAPRRRLHPRPPDAATALLASAEISRMSFGFIARTTVRIAASSGTATSRPRNPNRSAISA